MMLVIVNAFLNIEILMNFLVGEGFDKRILFFNSLYIKYFDVK